MVKGTDMVDIDEALSIFRRLLQCDTTNYGDGKGDESGAVKVLADVFSMHDIPYKIVSASPKRENIVARIEGNRSSAKKALLLSAHLDVVPAINWEDEGWKVNPFEAKELDGYIYGRGAIDMKHHAAMSASILIHVKKNKIDLNRDLIFAGVADEEDGSTYGSKYLIENHAELIDAEVVLTELGGFPMNILGSILYPIQIAEKGTCKIRITARGIGGHSSISHKDNCIGTIGQAASALCRKRLPLRLTPQVISQIDMMMECAGQFKGLIFAGLKVPYLHDVILDYVLPRELSRSLEPLFHNIAVPTIIKSGVKDNQVCTLSSIWKLWFNLLIQVPSSAELILHCRTLPGCSAQDVLQEIQCIVPQLNSESVDIVVENESNGVSHQTLNDKRMSNYFHLIDQVLRKTTPSGRAWPILIPGATDARYYSLHPNNMVCIGFAPFLLDANEKFTDLFHGTNERISMSGFSWGLRVLYEVVRDICCQTK